MSFILNIWINYIAIVMKTKVMEVTHRLIICFICTTYCTRKINNK